MLKKLLSVQLLSILGFLALAALVLLISACGGSSTPAAATPMPVNDNGDEMVVVDNDNNSDSTETGSNTDLPLLTISQFEYTGAFTIPAGEFGASNTNFADAVIEQSGNSLFLVGHAHDDAIAEFNIPDIVNSTNISELNSTGDPIQQFSTVLDRTVDDNPQNVNEIKGMEVYQGRLIVNGDEFYDAPGTNTHTTLVLSDASSLAASSVEGFLELPGAARSAGWITQVPIEWQETLDGDLIIGNSSGTAIISRHSVGPSAHTLHGETFLSATVNNPTVGTQNLLEYSLDNPLHEDLYNESKGNNIWTITSSAKFGFIVPGTRTYAVLGSSSGHEFGLGYKITQDDGNLCGGPCPYVASDEYNYYWLYDMNDLLEVKAGNVNQYDVRPYDYGKFDVPFQSSGSNAIGGGSFDYTSNTLYLSVTNANNTVGRYSNPPIIVTFTVDSDK